MKFKSQHNYTSVSRLEAYFIFDNWLYSHVANLYFLNCRSGNIHEVSLFLVLCEEDNFRKFKNLAKIIIIITLLKKNENSRIVNFVKSHKIRNSRIFEQAKITRSNII